MRVVRLNGELGRKYGRVHRLDVASPAEAIRALSANFPGFKQDIIDSADKGIVYKCVVDREQIDEEGLRQPMSKSFSLTPVVAGRGKIGKIILGTLLIAAAFIFAPPTVGAMGPTLGMSTGIGFAGLTFANVAWIGGAILLGGVAGLLAPSPKAGPAGERNENQYFNGPVNITAQGGCVPFGYGRMIVGSAVISAAITVEQAAGQSVPTDYRMMGFTPGVAV